MSSLDLFTLPTVFYPWFDLAHFICSARQVRKDTGEEFARKQPLASCAATIVSCFAGSLLTNLGLGKPLLTTFERQDKVLMSVAVWACINFCPKDSFLRLCSLRVGHTLCFSLKEIYRLRKIVRGVDLASQDYPTNPVIQLIAGVLKGSGSTLLRPLTKLMCGLDSGGVCSELLRPSLSTQISAGAAALWLFARGSAVVQMDQLYAAVTAGLVVWRLSVIAGEYRTQEHSSKYRTEEQIGELRTEKELDECRRDDGECRKDDGECEDRDLNQDEYEKFSEDEYENIVSHEEAHEEKSDLDHDGLMSKKML